ncbi:hypothetical protein [Micromonospora palomenae]|uniref:hypothetical protein n=1 Tax=Micromonospora palomenae TaxID=1461247 RepID=UPI001FEC3660|nr:hypothetical protein [Micromonospora palomenae]
MLIEHGQRHVREQGRQNAPLRGAGDGGLRLAVLGEDARAHAFTKARTRLSPIR